MPSTPAPDRFTRLTDLFRQACGRDASERLELVEDTRDADPELAADLEALLAADETAGSHAFLDPIPGVADAVRRAADDVSSSDGTPGSGRSATLDAPLTGHRIGDFELEGLIARGGMGAVYRARQSNPERVVAFKLLRDELPSSRLRERFRLEADVLARLQHPGIAAVHASGTTDDRPWLAMEYVAGARSITEHAEDACLDLKARVRLLRDVADAVRHAHQRGVIHRDLKPANLLVGDDGRAKVIDFGVARADDLVTQVARRTGAGELLGTLAYMSPEQCAGTPEDVDVRSDVYALGVVLYELVTGTRPLKLEGLSLIDAVSRVSRDGVPSLETTLPGVDADLQCIARVATALDAADRYQSTDALLADLDQWLAGEPIAARSPGPIRRVRLFIRHNKGISALIGAAAFAAACIGLTIAVFTVRLAEEGQATRVALGRSERMLDFLVNVLGSASDRHSDAPTRDLSEVLAGASRRAGLEFTDDPESEYRLREAIGVTLQTLGDHDAALREFELLATVSDRIEEVPGRRKATAIGHQASVRYLVDDFPRATSLYREAASLYRSDPETEASELLAVEQSLAILQSPGGGGDNSEKLRDLVDRARSLTGPASFRTKEMKETLAIVLIDDGRAREAEALLRDLVDDADATYAGPHPQRITARNNLGWALTNQGRFEDAIDVLEEAEAMADQLYEPTHPRSTWIRGTRLDAEVRAGRGAEREDEIRQLIADRTAVLGPRSSAVALAESLLWRVLSDAQRYDEALGAARSAHDRYLDLHGREHPTTARSMQQVGLTLSRLGRSDEALPMLEEALDLVRRLSGPESRAVALASNELGIAYAGAGRWSEALVAFDRSLTIYDGGESLDDPERVKALGNIGRSLLELERHADAVPFLEEGCRLAATIWPDDVTTRVLMETSYGEVLAATGAMDEARRRLEAVMPRLERLYAPDHARLTRIRRALGG